MLPEPSLGLMKVSAKLEVKGREAFFPLESGFLRQIGVLGDLQRVSLTALWVFQLQPNALLGSLPPLLCKLLLKAALASHWRLSLPFSTRMGRSLLC